jgi:hypothetical protein
MTSGLDRADDKRGKRASDGAASTTASATVPAATIAISARTSTTSTSNPSPTADRRPKPLRPGSATAAAAAAEYHPLSPSGTPRAHLARRVSSAEPAGYFDVAPRRHAASVSAVTTPGPASPASPAVAALQAVAASAAGGLAPRRVDDLLGLGIESGPSRRRRSVEPGSRPSAASLFGDEETPRRPRRALGSWAGYLDSLSRDEIEVLDTPFDVMSDSELLAALRSFGHAREGRKSSRRGSGSPTRRDTARTSNGDSHASPSPSPTKSALSSTPPQSTAAPLFPPSPPGPAVAHAEHPLRVLSRAVRELREVIARLEVENARLKDSAAPPLPAATLAAHTGARRFSSGSSALFSASNTPSAEASPRPVPLQSVAERPTDQVS